MKRFNFYNFLAVLYITDMTSDLQELEGLFFVAKH